MKYWLNILILLLSLTSCSLFEEELPECPDRSGEFFSLSFQVSTCTLRSRSDSENHAEVNSEIVTFEDGIDLDNLAIFIFARVAGGTDTDEHLLIKVTDLKNDDRLSVSGSPGLYTVNTNISNEEMTDCLGINIDPNNKPNVIFRVLMLANCLTDDSSSTPGWDAVNATTYSGVIEQLDQWSYPMNTIYNADYTGTDAEGIYAATNRNIPMTGTAVTSVDQASLYESRPDKIVFLREIYMLRSLAKVRVIDNIQLKNDDGYPRIMSASIISSQNAARQIPANALNYENGSQVHTPNPVNTGDLPGFNDAFQYRLGIIPGWMSITPENERKGNVFIGFIPEQNILKENSESVEPPLPVFRLEIAVPVQAEDPENPEKTMETRYFDVPLAGYHDQPFTFGNSILRNHIYTLSVEQVGVTLKFTVDLVPYRVANLDPWFGLDR